MPGRDVTSWQRMASSITTRCVFIMVKAELLVLDVDTVYRTCLVTYSIYDLTVSLLIMMFL